MVPYDGDVVGWHGPAREKTEKQEKMAHVDRSQHSPCRRSDVRISVVYQHAGVIRAISV
jgi:hypothetical protein